MQAVYLLVITALAVASFTDGAPLETRARNRRSITPYVLKLLKRAQSHIVNKRSVSKPEVLGLLQRLHSIEKRSVHPEAKDFVRTAQSHIIQKRSLKPLMKDFAKDVQQHEIAKRSTRQLLNVPFDEHLIEKRDVTDNQVPDPLQINDVIAAEDQSQITYNDMVTEGDQGGWEAEIDEGQDVTADQDEAWWDDWALEDGDEDGTEDEWGDSEEDEEDGADEGDWWDLWGWGDDSDSNEDEWDDSSEEDYSYDTDEDDYEWDDAQGEAEEESSEEDQWDEWWNEADEGDEWEDSSEEYDWEDDDSSEEGNWWDAWGLESPTEAEESEEKWDEWEAGLTEQEAEAEPAEVANAVSNDADEWNVIDSEFETPVDQEWEANLMKFLKKVLSDKATAKRK